MAIAKWIDRKGKERTIQFNHNGDNSWDNIAWEMANAYDRKVMAHRKGDPALYAFFKELSANARINYPLETRTNDIEDAFKTCELRNKSEKPFKLPNGKYYLRSSRVGYSFTDRIILDIDCTDITIVKETAKLYGGLFNSEYTIIKTGHGYWIRYHKIYSDIKQWRYDLCRILYPGIDYKDVDEYITLLKEAESKASKDSPIGFVSCGVSLRASMLVCPVSDVDIIHVYLTLKHDKLTIRASKKYPDEIIQEVKS